MDDGTKKDAKGGKDTAPAKPIWPGAKAKPTAGDKFVAAGVKFAVKGGKAQAAADKAVAAAKGKIKLTPEAVAEVKQGQEIARKSGLTKSGKPAVDRKRLKEPRITDTLPAVMAVPGKPYTDDKGEPCIYRGKVDGLHRLDYPDGRKRDVGAPFRLGGPFMGGKPARKPAAGESLGQAMKRTLKAVKRSKEKAARAAGKRTALPQVKRKAASAGKEAPKARRGALRKPRQGTLASVIDKHLHDGTCTIEEIADIAEKDAKRKGIKLRGRDLRANVRARMVHYRRKGWTVTRDKHNHVQMKAPKRGAAARSTVKPAAPAKPKRRKK